MSNGAENPKHDNGEVAKPSEPSAEEKIRRNLGIINDTMLSMLAIRLSEPVDGLKYSSNLRSALLRGIRMAAELNHLFVCVEHFLLALTLEDTTRPALMAAGYHPEVVRASCMGRLQGLKASTGTVGLGNPPNWSSWVIDWRGAAHKVAQRREPENQTVTLRDFLEAADSSNLLIQSISLKEVLGALLTKGSQPVVLQPVSRILRDGFFAIEQKLANVSTNVNRGEWARRRSMSRFLKRFRSSSAKIVRLGEDVKAVGEDLRAISSLFPYQASVLRLSLFFSLLGAVAVGTIAGLLARNQYGAF